MDMSVIDWLKQDRQWTRPLRVAHARYKLAMAYDPAETLFWQAVLEALGEKIK